MKLQTEKTIKKIHETKRCFFENNIKIDRPLPKQTNKKGDTYTTIRNERVMTLQTLQTRVMLSEKSQSPKLIYRMISFL